jgi:hypothetical protein
MVKASERRNRRPVREVSGARAVSRPAGSRTASAGRSGDWTVARGGPRLQPSGKGRGQARQARIRECFLVHRDHAKLLENRLPDECRHAGFSFPNRR